MRSPKTNWYWISNALKDRHKGGNIDKELKPEIEWIANVLKLLKKEEEKASGLAKVRIQRTIPDITPPDERPAEAGAEPIAPAGAPEADDAVMADED